MEKYFSCFGSFEINRVLHSLMWPFCFEVILRKKEIVGIISSLFPRNAQTLIARKTVNFNTPTANVL